VVVWIHGGSLVLGSTSMFPGMAFLAASTNMIFVVPNYRVGAHGFLALDSLAAHDTRGGGISGNYGLLDQIHALKWVQRNIFRYGGDKKRVSVWGQSSGGTSIYAYFAMPSANGLFTSAVSLSGSPNISISLAEANLQNQAMLRSLNGTAAGTCSLPMEDAQFQSPLQSQLACLLNLSSADAAMLPPGFNVGPVAPLATNGQHYPGLPVVDGITLVMPVLDAMRSSPAIINAAFLLVVGVSLVTCVAKLVLLFVCFKLSTRSKIPRLKWTRLPLMRLLIVSRKPGFVPCYLHN